MPLVIPPIVGGAAKAATSGLGAKALSALGGIGGSVIGGLFGKSGVEDTNAMNYKIAKENRAFQERMSSSAYTRAAKDLESAGLNRILALGGPSSTPAGNVATMQNPNQQLAEGLRESSGKAIAALTAKQQLQNMAAQKKLTDEQATKTYTETGAVQENTRRTNIENQLLDQRLGVYLKYPWLMETDMLLGGNAAQVTMNTARGAVGMLKQAQNARKTLTTQTTKYGPRGEYAGGAVTTRGTKP